MARSRGVAAKPRSAKTRSAKRRGAGKGDPRKRRSPPGRKARRRNSGQTRGSGRAPKSTTALAKLRTPSKDLVIAVTGHRSFAKGEAAVAALIREELERIAANGSGGTVTVVTALAEGADRLVADLARDVLDARVVVCLPMPAEAYETDFAGAASRRRFRSMLKAADKVVTGPILSKGRAWRSWTEERNHQYAWAGAYVAKNADILFAVWDGKPARGTGGTAHVVDWFLDGRAPRRYAMSRWKLDGGGGSGSRTLVHVNPDTLKVRRRKV